MMDVGRHPKIKLLANSEVENVTGYVGNFSVTVRQKARYVQEGVCNSCGECVKVCPVITPDEYQQGFSSRKAIYLPFGQAVPSCYLIDMKSCLGINPIACGKCADVCEQKCIDYDMKDELIKLDVGAIIVATGMEVYDPTEMDEYCYREYPNVITSMEFERLICASGPTDGHFVRPSDQKRPRRIGFIQCVGSRSHSVKGSPYCSNVCCMNTVKDTLLLHDHYPDVECKVFYIDIRAFGKGFEDLFMRSKQAGVKYIRGLPGEIREDSVSKNLTLTAENTTIGRVEEHEFDMVVLSVGVLPRQDNDKIKELLTLSRTADGFYMESHPKLKPVDTPTAGVFLAGCAEGPKDIKDSVTQASASAARAGILLSKGEIKAAAITAVVDVDLCNACGVCEMVCPYRAIVVDAKNKVKAQVITAACAGCGTCGAACTRGAITLRHFTDAQYYTQIDSILEQDPMEKVVVFACKWCSYSGGDFAGVSRLQYPESPRLIRTMCSGRVDEEFVKYAFHKGAPVVLVSGCHYADCHYINANRQTVKRVQKLWDFLERNHIRPERLQLEWISAAEGQKFAKVMKRMEELRSKVTKEEVAETVRILTELEKNKAEKKVAAGV